MNELTFIIASLNNGYDNAVTDPVTDFHFQRTIFCVNYLVNKLNAHVIFVDWCSSEDKAFKNFLAKEITYIYVPQLVIRELHKNNEATMLFYEWIAKDIGAFFCKTKNLLFTNGDNIFPTHIKKELENINTDNSWYSGTRINIDNSAFNDINFSSKIEEIPNGFNALHVCDFCHGDFTIVSKKNYDSVDGYNYTHRHAYEDTFFCQKLEKNGIKQQQIKTPFYHINHSGTGRHFISSTAPIDKSYIKNIILNNIQITKT